MKKVLTLLFLILLSASVFGDTWDDFKGSVDFSVTIDTVASAGRNKLVIIDGSIASITVLSDVEETFLAAFAAGQSFISTGPILDVTVGDSLPGSTISAGGGQVTLTIDVRAADWIPVEELRIIVDGVVVHQESLAAATGVNRFSGSVTVDVPAFDSFVLVECGASLANIAAGAFPGDRFAEIYPGVQPLAFTNPFLVDGDGDGSWQ